MREINNLLLKRLRSKGNYHHVPCAIACIPVPPGLEQGHSGSWRCLLTPTTPVFSVELLYLTLSLCLGTLTLCLGSLCWPAMG